MYFVLKTVLMLHLALILLNFSDTPLTHNRHCAHMFILTAHLHHPIFWLLVSWLHSMPRVNTVQQALCCSIVAVTLCTSVDQLLYWLSCSAEWKSRHTSVGILTKK
jgi:hypothetical protein